MHSLYLHILIIFVFLGIGIINVFIVVIRLLPLILFAFCASAATALRICTDSTKGTKIVPSKSSSGTLDETSWSQLAVQKTKGSVLP